MNKIIFLISATLILAKSIYADDNCTDTKTFPTIPTQCTCIINNAINDCKLNSPTKSICNKLALGHFFKSDIPSAISRCESYGGEPDQCKWSINFYDTNC